LRHYCRKVVFFLASDSRRLPTQHTSLWQMLGNNMRIFLSCCCCCFCCCVAMPAEGGLALLALQM
jgi:hypothetical protein